MIVIDEGENRFDDVDVYTDPEAFRMSKEYSNGGKKQPSFYDDLVVKPATQFFPYLPGAFDLSEHINDNLPVCSLLGLYNNRYGRVIHEAYQYTLYYDRLTTQIKGVNPQTNTLFFLRTLNDPALVGQEEKEAPPYWYTRPVDLPQDPYHAALTFRYDLAKYKEQMKRVEPDIHKIFVHVLGSEDVTFTDGNFDDTAECNAHARMRYWDLHDQALLIKGGGGFEHQKKTVTADDLAKIQDLRESMTNIRKAIEDHQTWSSVDLLQYKLYGLHEFEPIMDGIVQGMALHDMVNMFPSWEFSQRFYPQLDKARELVQQSGASDLSRENLTELAYEVFGQTVTSALSVAYANSIGQEGYRPRRDYRPWGEAKGGWFVHSATNKNEINAPGFYAFGLFNTDAARLSTSEVIANLKQGTEAIEATLQSDSETAMAGNENRIESNRKHFFSGAGVFDPTNHEARIAGLEFSDLVDVRYPATDKKNDAAGFHRFDPSSVGQVVKLKRSTAWTASPTALLAYPDDTGPRRDYDFEKRLRSHGCGVPYGQSAARIVGDKRIWFQSIDIDIDIPLLDISKEFVVNLSEVPVCEVLEAVEDVFKDEDESVVNEDLLKRLFAAYNFFSGLEGIIPLIDINPVTFKPHFTILTPPIRKSAHVFLSKLLASTFFDGYADEAHLNMAGSPHQMITRPGSFVKGGRTVRTVILSPTFDTLIPTRIRQNWLIPNEDGTMPIINPADFMAHASTKSVEAFVKNLGLSYDTGAITGLLAMESTLGDLSDVFATKPKNFNPTRLEPMSRSDIAGINLYNNTYEADGTDEYHINEIHRVSPNNPRDVLAGNIHEDVYIHRFMYNNAPQHMREVTFYKASTAPIELRTHALLPFLRSWASDEHTVTYQPPTAKATSENQDLAPYAKEAIALLASGEKPYLDVYDINNTRVSHANFLALQGRAASHIGLRHLAELSFANPSSQGILHRLAQKPQIVANQDNLRDLEKTMAQRAKDLFDSIRHEKWYKNYINAVIAPMQEMGISLDDTLYMNRMVYYVRPYLADGSKRVPIENYSITGYDYESEKEHVSDKDGWYLENLHNRISPDVFGDKQEIEQLQEALKMAANCFPRELEEKKIRRLDGDETTWFDFMLTKIILNYERLWQYFLLTGEDIILETEKALASRNYFDERFGCELPPGYLVLHPDLQTLYFDTLMEKPYDRTPRPKPFPLTHVNYLRANSFAQYTYTDPQTGEVTERHPLHGFARLTTGDKRPMLVFHEGTMDYWSTIYGLHDIPDTIRARSLDKIKPGELILARLIELWNERQQTIVENMVEDVAKKHVSFGKNLFHVGVPLAILNDLEAHKDEYFPLDLAHAQSACRQNLMTPQALECIQDVQNIIDACKAIDESEAVINETTYHVVLDGVRRLTLGLPERTYSGRLSTPQPLEGLAKQYTPEQERALDLISRWIISHSPDMLGGAIQDTRDITAVSVATGAWQSIALDDGYPERDFVFDGKKHKTLSVIAQELTDLGESICKETNDLGFNRISVYPLASAIYDLLASSNQPSVRWLCKEIGKTDTFDFSALISTLDATLFELVQPQWTTSRDAYERQAQLFPYAANLSSLHDRVMREDGSIDEFYLEMFARQVGFLHRKNATRLLTNKEVTPQDLFTAWVNEAASYGEYATTTTGVIRSGRSEVNLVELHKKYDLDKKDGPGEEGADQQAVSDLSKTTTVQDIYNDLIRRRTRFYTSHIKGIKVTCVGINTHSAAKAIHKLEPEEFNASKNSIGLVMSVVKNQLLMGENETIDRIKTRVMDAYHNGTKQGAEAVILSAIALGLQSRADSMSEHVRNAGASFAHGYTISHFPSSDLHSWSAADVEKQLDYACGKLKEQTSEQAKRSIMTQAELIWSRGGEKTAHSDSTPYLDGRKDTREKRSAEHDEKVAKRKAYIEESGGKFNTAIALVKGMDSDNPHIAWVGKEDPDYLRWAQTEGSDELRPIFTKDLYEAFCRGEVINTQYNAFGECYSSQLLSPVCAAVKPVDASADLAKRVNGDAANTCAMTPDTFVVITHLIAMGLPYNEPSWDAAIKIASGLATWKTRNANSLAPLTARHLETLSGVSAQVSAQAMKILTQVGLLSSPTARRSKGKIEGTLIGAKTGSDMETAVTAHMAAVNGGRTSILVQEEELEKDFAKSGTFASTYRNLGNDLMFTDPGGTPFLISTSDVVNELEAANYTSIQSALQTVIFESYLKAVDAGENVTPGDRRGKDISTLNLHTRQRLFHLIFAPRSAPRKVVEVLRLIAGQFIGKNTTVDPIFAHTSELYRGKDSRLARKGAFVIHMLSAALKGTGENIYQYNEAIQTIVSGRFYKDKEDTDSLIANLRSAVSTSSLLFRINQAKMWEARKAISAQESREFRREYITWVSGMKADGGPGQKNMLEHKDINANQNPALDSGTFGPIGGTGTALLTKKKKAKARKRLLITDSAYSKPKEIDLANYKYRPLIARKTGAIALRQLWTRAGEIANTMTYSSRGKSFPFSHNVYCGWRNGLPPEKQGIPYSVEREYWGRGERTIYDIHDIMSHKLYGLNVFHKTKAGEDRQMREIWERYKQKLRTGFFGEMFTLHDPDIPFHESLSERDEYDRQEEAAGYTGSRQYSQEYYQRKLDQRWEKEAPKIERRYPWARLPEFQDLLTTLVEYEFRTGWTPGNPHEPHRRGYIPQAFISAAKFKNQDR